MILLANSYQQGIAQDMQWMMTIMVVLGISSVLATLCYVFLFEPVSQLSKDDETEVTDEDIKTVIEVNKSDKHA